MEQTQQGAFKTNPYQHQVNYLNIGQKKRYYANGSEQGTGKTWMSINEAAMLWGQGKINNILVIAPNGVHTNWYRREIPEHMPDWVRYKSAAWDAEKTRKDDKFLDDLFNETDSTVLRIFCVSWDAMSHVRSQHLIEKFCITSSNLLIIADESHNAGNPSSIRSKFLHKLHKYSAARRILSGTFMFNSPFDIFSQFSFLDERILGTTSFYAFKNEYAEIIQPGHRMFDAIMKELKAKSGKENVRAPQIVAKDKHGNPKYKNIEKLHRLIEPYTFRVLKSECLDLPQKIYTQSFFELTSKQRETYRLLFEECRIMLEDGTMTPMQKLAAMSKLPQVPSNFLINTETKKVQIIDKERHPKLELMQSRLEELKQYGTSAIVFAKFRYELVELKRLCEKLGISLVEYHGGISKTQREFAIDEFQRKQIQIFLAQNKAASTGLTLTAAERVFYYSNLWSFGTRIQSEDRAHRIGQRKNVIYEDIIGLETIDERIVQSLRLKKHVFDVVTGDILRLQ